MRLTRVPCLVVAAITSTPNSKPEYRVRLNMGGPLAQRARRARTADTKTSLLSSPLAVKVTRRSNICESKRARSSTTNSSPTSTSGRRNPSRPGKLRQRASKSRQPGGPISSRDLPEPCRHSPTRRHRAGNMHRSGPPLPLLPQRESGHGWGRPGPSSATGSTIRRLSRSAQRTTAAQALTLMSQVVDAALRLQGQGVQVRCHDLGEGPGHLRRWRFVRTPPTG